MVRSGWYPAVFSILPPYSHHAGPLVRVSGCCRRGQVKRCSPWTLCADCAGCWGTGRDGSVSLGRSCAVPIPPAAASPEFRGFRVLWHGMQGALHAWGGSSSPVLSQRRQRDTRIVPRAPHACRGGQRIGHSGYRLPLNVSFWKSWEALSAKRRTVSLNVSIQYRPLRQSAHHDF